MTQQDVDLLSLGLGHHEQQLTKLLRAQLQADFDKWVRAQQSQTSRQLRSVPWRARQDYARQDQQSRRRRKFHEPRQLLDFLISAIPEKLEALESLRVGQRDFRETFALTVSQDERRRLVSEYAQRLGSTRRHQEGDRDALDRWFGDAAVTRRYRRRLGNLEQSLEYAVRRLGYVVRHIHTILEDVSTAPGFWQRTRLADTLGLVLRYEGDARVHRACYAAYRVALETVPLELRQHVVSAEQKDAAVEIASDPTADTWLQTNSLDFLAMVDPFAADRVLQHRLRNPLAGDDMFFRRHALRHVGQSRKTSKELVATLTCVLKDPSPFVRQQLAQTAWCMGHGATKYVLSELMLEDENPKVRAAAVASILDKNLVDDESIQASLVGFLKLLTKVLREERDPFVLRTALHVASEIPDRIGDEPRSQIVQNDVLSFVRRQLLSAIRSIQTGSGSVSLRRWAAESAERLWVRGDEEANSLRRRVSQLAKLRPKRSKWISQRWMGTDDKRLLGRVLAVMSQEDYGFDLRRTWGGYWVSRPPVFLTRAWRILHELSNPTTDKRQAFPHTIGRVSNADLRVPSRVLAELSQTKVPGEPLFIAEENGWRPFLPLLDDFLSALSASWFRPREIEFYSAEGITMVDPPDKVWERMWAWFVLTISFAKIAELRNWMKSDSISPDSYIQYLRKLGFAIRFQPYEAIGRRYTDPGREDGTTVEDQSVTKFFSIAVGMGLTSIIDTVYRFSEYFKSVYENSLSQLFVFIIAVIVLFLSAHLISNVRVFLARRHTPLSLGGWGTRGKSGTERLKASLVSGMGYSLLSKTTGCEAMFLLGDTYGETREIPLFRPLDKATIWEHRNVLQMAAATQSSVFLWECMGLTPEYVDVLQRQWTRDDLVTLTNAYPDHEDLQGPAGWNVATTIAGFAPTKARLLTTEFQMLPLIRTACDEVETSCRDVAWLRAGLLTDDVLERFPYTEHPDNIALVAAMGEELGVHDDFAVKEMADHLIADLGVLRTYPVATVGTRRLEFTNGMSANERRGCMGNWERTGFQDHDPLEQPDVWITTLVNNRADRVSRSKVFASIVVNDMDVDRVMLVGSNLSGFIGFLWAEWETRMSELNLWRGDQPAAVVWEQQARKMRVTRTLDEVKQRLQAMLRGIDQDKKQVDDVAKLVCHVAAPDELSAALRELHFATETVEEVYAFHVEMLQWLAGYEAILTKIQSATESEKQAVDRACKSQLRTWFEGKLVVVEDFFATGEQVIQRLLSATPPGLLNRNMGLQNIKGTGLGYVYEWQAWLMLHQWCQDLRGNDVQRAEAAALGLMECKKMGILAQEELSDTIVALNRDGRLHKMSVDINALDARVRGVKSGQVVESEETNGGASRLAWILAQIEDLLDAWDGVRRRRKADLIYRDIQDERISVDDAISELRIINARQKGGWLQMLVQKWWPAKKATRRKVNLPEPIPEVRIEEQEPFDDTEAPLQQAGEVQELRR